MNQNQILGLYENITPDLVAFQTSMDKKIEALLATQSFKIHSLSSRLKSNPALYQKILRPDRTYTSLWDITDLVAFRIVTYFEDTIDEVAKMIEENFSVDFKNSINKLRIGDLDRFGYRSIHYICSSGQNSPHENFKFEVQIRTVLQHAWAEVEHDLGYKTQEALPAEIRRRFSQVAGLLEIADREFMQIRKDIKTYEQSLKLEAENTSEDVSLNQISLEKFMTSKEVEALDQEVAVYLNKPVVSDFFYSDYLLRVLKASGIKNINTLRKAISDHQSQVASFIGPYFLFAKEAWNLDSQSITQIQRGYSLLFLAQLILLKKEKLFLNKINQLKNFYQEVDYPNDTKLAEDIARALTEELRKANHPAVI